MHQLQDIITVNSKWIHKETKNEYIIVVLSNLYSTKYDLFPATVVYKSGSGIVWSRTVNEFLNKFTKV